MPPETPRSLPSRNGRRIEPLWQLKPHFRMPSIEAPFPFGGGADHAGGVESVPTTKSGLRRANDQAPALGTEVQVQSKPTRAKRRSEHLRTKGAS